MIIPFGFLKGSGAAALPDIADATVRFIVQNASSLTTYDTYVKNIMEGLGITVTPVTQTTGTYSDVGQDFTVSSESTFGSRTNSLLSSTQPLIMLEAGNTTGQLIATNSNTVSYGTLSFTSTHSILTGVTSPFEYNLSGADLGQGKAYSDPSATASAYLVEATEGDAAGRYAIIAFNTGDTLTDGTSTAAGKRVFMGAYVQDQWSADTQTIFKNALKWSYGSLL